MISAKKIQIIRGFLWLLRQQRLTTRFRGHAQCLPNVLWALIFSQSVPRRRVRDVNDTACFSVYAQNCVISFIVSHTGSAIISSVFIDLSTKWSLEYLPYGGTKGICSGYAFSDMSYGLQTEETLVLGKIR